MSGALAPEDLATPEYWVRHVREAVRFADGIRTLEAAKVDTYLELGPDAVLSALGEACLTEERDVAFAATARRDRDEVRELVTAMVLLHARGAAVDWPAFFAGRGARQVDLPTYAFQHQEYWLTAPTAAGEVSGLGQDPAEHPLLGAVLALPESDGVALTGRLSARTHPWLADHDLHGSMVFPASGLVELALHAGERVGYGTLAELTLGAPLVLPEHGSVAIQVVVGAPEDSGTRTVSVHARGEDAQAPWIRCAGGRLAEREAEPAAAEAVDLSVWPPSGTTAVDLADAYDRLLAQGHGYGPAFQGLTAAWRRGTELFAEVALPQELTADRFGLHPALLDSALHLALLGTDRDVTRFPTAWTGVRLHAAGATALRVRLAPAGDGAHVLDLADAAGRPVASVASVASRPVTPAELTGAAAPDALFQLDWQPLAPGAPVEGAWAVLGSDALGLPGDVPRYPDLSALLAECETGAPVPAHVVHAIVAPDADVPSVVREVTGGVLALVKAWLADERLSGATLVLATRQAVGRPGEPVAPALAPVWGLVRSAQAEHPDRFVLADLDGSEPSVRALPAALATGGEELMLRQGQLLAPRLVAVPAEGEPGEGAPAPTPWSTNGTVLITGGTTGAGAALARHLVAAHGVRHLLLTAAGPAAEADDLRAELARLGAAATVTACDPGDRAALAELLDGIPAEHPLTAVVHTAAVTDHALITALTGKQLDAVLHPKVDGAWHLHELTRDHDLSAFVLLSSATGLLHGAGAANYAAANVFLDALAVHRAAQGRPALSLAFGAWDAAEPDEAHRKRLTRLGLPPLDGAEGLALLDRALRTGRPALVPLRLDRSTLRATADELPALLRGVVRVPARTSARSGGDAASQLRRRLAGLGEGERGRVLLELVRSQVAAVLGHPSMDAVEPDQAFKELGFDSFAAIELRKRLGSATGLALPATLVFDYPTSRAVADHATAAIEPAGADAAAPVLGEVDRLDAALAAFTPVNGEVPRITARLEALVRRWHDLHGVDPGAGAEHDLDSATDDELFEVLDGELGIS